MNTATRIFTVAAMMLSTFSLSAQEQWVIERHDGTVIRTNVEEIKQMTIEEKSTPESSSRTTSRTPVAEFVDLGLSVKWATCNIGAERPEDYGDYFAWGETEAHYTSLAPKVWKADKSEGYNWNTYYDPDCEEYNILGAKTVLTLEDDAAHILWGEDWRMPTRYELYELSNLCSWTWYEPGNETFGGVPGYKVQSKKDGYTDNYIFIPAAGYFDGKYVRYKGYKAYIWSSSIDLECSDSASNLSFSPTDHKMRTSWRYYGHTIRPVCR